TFFLLVGGLHSTSGGHNRIELALELPLEREKLPESYLKGRGLKGPR
ncbi:hypothetical protein L917_19049, partial [Phytophthora nicotianae]